MIKLRYIGPFGQHSGYASAGQDLLKAINMHIPADELSLDIQPLGEDEITDLDPRYSDLLPFVDTNNDPNWPDVVLVHTIPKYCSDFVKGDLATSAKKIAYTTWESDWIDDKIKKDLFTSFDKVLVPSEHNYEVFSGGCPYSEGSRYPSKLELLPHCYNPDDWADVKKTESYKKKDGVTKFLWIGVWSERKNPIGLLKTYFATFKRTDPVELTMLIHGFGENQAKELRDLIQKMNLSYDDLPRINTIYTYQTFDQVKQLHADADVYVSLHRGEGFGLGMFESVIVGNQVIATGYGGSNDFLKEHYLIEYNMTPCLISSTNTANKDLGIDGRQWWAEPNLNDASAAMYQQIFFKEHSPPKHRTNYFDAFTYENVAKKMRSIIEETL